MAVEIVTIVNSSGKIISNGKHLVNAFKEAKAAYDEKKAAVKAERAIRRAQTFDIPTEPRYEPEPNYEYEYGRGDPNDDGVSQTSSRRSHRSRHSRASRHRSASQSRQALTEGNLRTHSEVSSVTPSRPPVTYRSPYAETAPRDMALSRPMLARAPTVPYPPTEVTEQMPMENALMQRSRSDPALLDTGKKKKEIDMNLAYGSIPPDLADRVDLDPAYHTVEKERSAHKLVAKVEDLLVEAQCMHHTATHIIEHLQAKPEAAAAVALTLAELSALLGKMSPSFLGVIKGGSPAIFALLSSPQFLIAAGLTVGVTVVMFGGWKIIKRIKEAKEAEAAARMAPMAFEANPGQPAQQPVPHQAQPPYPESETSQGFDEALVVEEELSTIETWRRGITPFGEDGSADLELISPEADRAIRSQYGGDDARTERSVRTHRTSKTHKSHRSHRSRAHDDSDAHERKSRRHSLDEGGDDVSESGSHRSHRSHRSHHSHRSHDSHKSEKTERSSRTKRSSKPERLAIEDGSRDKENTIEAVLRPKKDNMLKSLFKKKKKEEDEQRTSSLLRV
ncbi:hypothetical protein EKO27_g1932 [Xylaria grammica]|uniref:Uncharacterized protein n=1 Tax=Xylaria grammica TaxID=363999 RepID=A0A439DFH2_9PEZI|nr:hypothetical protein EKO27_g1932 [Xylaria grammica]